MPVIAGGQAQPGSLRTYCEFQQEPQATKRLGGAVTGATGDRRTLWFPGKPLLGNIAAPGALGCGFEDHVKGTQTILLGNLTANGFDIAMDQTASDGIEITQGITTRCPVATVARDGRKAYLRVKAKVGDASGCNPFIVGWRKAEAYQAAHTSYADYAAIGIIGTANPNTIQICTQTGGGGNTNTDTTNTWADAAAKELAVCVNGDGKVTFSIDGAAPTVTLAYQFANALDIVPFIYFLQAADVCDTLELQLWDAAVGVG